MKRTGKRTTINAKMKKRILEWDPTLAPIITIYKYTRLGGERTEYLYINIQDPPPTNAAQKDGGWRYDYSK